MKVKFFISSLIYRLRLKFALRDIHYINGPNGLPAPLTAQEESEIMERISAGEEELRNELVVHNLRLVVYISKKFETSNVGIEDLVSIGTIGLIKAVKTFKSEKNIKLATYASRCIENEILMFLRKTSSQKAEISIDEPLNIDWDGNELLLSDVLGSDADLVNRHIESADERKQLLMLVDKLKGREREIMLMRYGLMGYTEHTQKQVADIFGISQSYISRIEKRIIEKLKKDLEKIGI